ncbi:hypothetical protein CPLU01_09784 [Colletotrichum plurivorum]|uniref:Uncharacterized protein n=1 Tax=Colletotrichum plurivorum TaxID=2175906 RepID=A0A8H6K851_9PEZI|nr:hypothetical protein CPLU01_09784 [Colletotrichum plurivorum]
MARPADVKGTIARLRAEAESYGDVPRHGPDEDDESHCYYDPAAAKVQHRPCCLWWDPDLDCADRSSCGIEEQLHRLGQIERLEAAPLWSMALEHPRLAAGSSLLARDAVYSSWAFHYDLQRHRKRGYGDGVAEMEFRGYRVVWPEDGAEIAAAARCCAAAAGLLAVVLGARAVHGEWGTAYAAGAFYVALAGVVSTWIGRSGGLGKMGRNV